MSRRERVRARTRPSIRDPYADPRRASLDDQAPEVGRRPGDRPVQRRGSESSASRPDQRLALAMLPLRLFLGGTFVYAGIDKIIDPTFLRSSGPGSIAAQLEAFTRVSPVGGLVHLFGQPFPVAIGWLIALAEIAIGLGALTGLALRLAALGGAGLSFLFWLTASWTTQPYFYGPDLPYAFAWLTLAFVGHGGRFTIEGWFTTADDVWTRDGPDVVIDRRVVLQAAVLGMSAVIVGAVGGTLGRVFVRPAVASAGGLDGSGGLGPSPGGDIAASTAPGATPGSTLAAGGSSPAATASGTVIARMAQLNGHRAVRFTIPQTQDPGVVLKLASGSVVAYDTTCTHAGCEVEYDTGSGLLICPCHGATFDPAHGAEVLGGPTNQPLLRLPITVDAASGRVFLTG